MKKGNQNSQTTQIHILLGSVLSKHQQVYPDIKSRNLDTTDKNIIHIIQLQQEYEYRKKIQNSIACLYYPLRLKSFALADIYLWAIYLRKTF